MTGGDASRTRGTVIAVVAAALILLLPSFASASQCSPSERVDLRDAECLSASWRNRGIFKKSTYRVRNMCAAYGRVAAKVDLVAARDRTANLDDGRPRRGWAWRQIRSISCCSDNGRELRPLRLEARLGYGFAAFGGRFTSTPETAVGLSGTGRDYSLGWRLARDRGVDGRVLELALELRRRETAGAAPHRSMSLASA